jgi:succinoglycan biosynthesis transport protein ExoP
VDHQSVKFAVWLGMAALALVWAGLYLWHTRHLLRQVQQNDVATPIRPLLAPAPEVASSAAINLAITMADAGSRVALIDADLRRPSIAEYMGLEGEVGLTTVLIGQANLQDAIQHWGTGSLHVLPSGQVPPNPSELLGSRSMARLLEQLSSQYDVVLIDTAPLLPMADAAILATITGGALVVAAADRLHRQELADGLGSLEDVGARVLGVVLNRMTHRQTDAYSYYDYASTATRAGNKSKQSRASMSEPKQRRASRLGLRAPSDLSEAAETDRQPVLAASPDEGDS